LKTNIIDFSLKINDKSIFFVGALSPLRIWEENRITFKSLPTTQKHTLFNIYALPSMGRRPKMAFGIKIV